MRNCSRQSAWSRQLRDCSEFELMAGLAEAISRRDPKDARNRRLYAQALIEAGKATAAIDLLQPLARRLPKTDAEYAEVARPARAAPTSRSSSTPATRASRMFAKP